MKKSTLLLFVMLNLFLCIFSQAQNSGTPNFYLVDTSTFYQLTSGEREMLKKELPLIHKAKEDTSKLQLVYKLYSRMNDNDVWILYLDWIQKELKIKNIQKRYPLFHDKMNSGLLNDQGYYYSQKGNLSLALDHYISSLKIKEKLGNKKGIANAINNIGLIYYNQGEVEKALENDHKGLRIYEEIKDTAGIASSLNNIAVIYQNQGDYDRALGYHEKSLSLNKSIHDTLNISFSLDNMGEIYRLKGDLAKAKEYSLAGLSLREKLNFNPGIANSLNHIAKIYYEQGDINSAIEYSSRSLKIGIEIGYVEKIRNAAENLYEFYKEKNHYEEALEMHELFVKMRDSIFNENVRNKSIKEQFKYDYDKKALADSVKTTEEKKVVQAQLKQEKTQRYALYGGLALVLVFSGVMFNRFKVTQKQKQVIEIKEKETQHQKHLIEEKQKEILDSISYAKYIQEAILPTHESIKRLLPNSFIVYLPKDIVAGDFYFVEEHNNAIYIAAADCTGHGVPGAMVSVICSNALTRAVKEFRITEAGKILDKTRELVLETLGKNGNNIKDGMDISLVVVSPADMNQRSINITWAGANNPLWIIRKGENKELEMNGGITQGSSIYKLDEIKADKQPIGKTDNPKPFVTYSSQLSKGDSIYLFTDGFADQFGGEKGKKFKYSPLKEKLLAIKNDPLEEQKKILETTFNNWKGNLEQVDDVLIIGIRV